MRQASLIFAAAAAMAMLLPARQSLALGLASEAPSTPWGSRAIGFSKHIVARPGETVRADTFYALAPDCSQRGWPEMQVRFAPSAGRVWDERATGRPGYPAWNVRHACNAGVHPGDAVYYRAPEGFRGRDHFTVWEIFPNGRGAQKSIDVDVR